MKIIQKSILETIIPLEINQNLTIVVLILCFGLMGYVKGYYGKRWKYILAAPFLPISTTFEEDQLSYSARPNLLLLLNLVLVSSLTISQIFSISGVNMLIAPLIILGYFLIKRLLIVITGYIFDTRQESREYLHMHSVFTLNLGLYLFIWALIYMFSPFSSTIIEYGIAIFFTLLLLFRLGKIVIASFRYRFAPIYYIILYICTLEILPLLTLYRFTVTI